MEPREQAPLRGARKPTSRAAAASRPPENVPGPFGPQGRRRARELHLNRQTLYNRLARIAELLGTDLDDPETVLSLSLALRARRHTAS
ncbi:hypothetical protein SSAG_05321 [Streptomyces sp. Mg1]|nr:hypothetical protein SSAG_05321 [Streptomyces sp. Mg1]